MSAPDRIKDAGTPMCVQPQSEEQAACILSEQAEGIGWITIHNPARRNALTLAMWQQLAQAATRLDSDPEVRVVVLRGAGERAFASGADITEFEKYRSDAEQKRNYSLTSVAAQSALQNLSKPLIALISGYCIGGGLVLAMTADIRYACRSARFGVPTAKMGSGYEYMHTAALARLIGPSATKDILFTGRHVDGEEAHRLGLVNFLASPQDLEDAVRAYAQSIASNAPLSLTTAKAAIRAFEIYSQVPQGEDIAVWVDRCYNSYDYREGWTAFLEKRKPSFLGK